MLKIKRDTNQQDLKTFCQILISSITGLLYYLPVGLILETPALYHADPSLAVHHTHKFPPILTDVNGKSVATCVHA